MLVVALINIMENKLGDGNQKASLSECKKTKVALVPHHTLWCVPTATSGGVNVPKIPECHLLRILLSMNHKKLLHGKVSREFTAYLSDFDCNFNSIKLPYYQKPDNQIHQADNFESHNSQKLGFTNIQGILSNFV